MTRVIAGAAGSLRLEVPKSGTRPTSDRVREAIFSALDAWGMLDETRVLDLYAGSGALGLEAASRGAHLVTLVERHAQSAQVTARNARTVRGAFSEDRAPSIQVERQSVQSFLEEQDRTPAWDVVLLDPPYDLGEAALTANLALLTPLLRDAAVVLVERSQRSPEPTWPPGLALLRTKRYGDSALWWAEAGAPTAQH
ncbi:MAG: 16S rRNA (guanine(966)-N(2))-methyltransferase RsmD [Leucobacter sp.]